MPKPKKQTAQPDDRLLLEPSLVALRKHLDAAKSTLEQQTVSLQLPLAGDGAHEQAGDDLVALEGLEAPATNGGCRLKRPLLLCVSDFYRHAARFGPPPTSVSLDCGDRCVRLLGAALSSGSALLGPTSLAELLQAASYLQVPCVLDACAAFLQSHLLDTHAAVVLRVALDLGLAALAAHIEADFLQEFYKLSGEKAALLLREWPPGKRRELLASPQLVAPTECCLVETLCHLAKAASSADAVSLLDCVRFELMSAHEQAAVTLYVQHNIKWVDRRLSTALAWRLLNAKVGADLAAWPAASTVPRAPGVRGGEAAVTTAGVDGPSSIGASSAEFEHPRPMRRRCLLWGLSTARLASWSGTAMYLCNRCIPCSFDRHPGDGMAGGPEGPREGTGRGPPAGAGRPLMLQLEREDPRHGPAEAVGGATGRAGGDTDSGGTGWDVQLSRAPDKFPAGFEAVCFAFGSEGFFWCGLGPLAKPGPTWWKVGFLASQLPKALPTAVAAAAAAGRPTTAGGASAGGGGDDDGFLLVGWWVPEQ